MNRHALNRAIDLIEGYHSSSPADHLTPQERLDKARKTLLVNLYTSIKDIKNVTLEQFAKGTNH